MSSTFSNNIADMNIPNLIRKGNKITKEIIHLNFSYFTIWVLFLQLLYHTDILINYQASILILASIVSISGLIITYYYPRHIYIPYLDIDLTENNVRLVDLIFHHIPLAILIMRLKKRIPNDNLLLALFTILVYLLLFKPRKVYNMNCHDCKNEKIVIDKSRCKKVCFVLNVFIVLLVIGILYKIVRSVLVN